MGNKEITSLKLATTELCKFWICLVGIWRCTMTSMTLKKFTTQVALAHYGFAIGVAFDIATLKTLLVPIKNGVVCIFNGNSCIP